MIRQLRALALRTGDPRARGRNTDGRLTDLLQNTTELLGWGTAPGAPVSREITTVASAVVSTRRIRVLDSVIGAVSGWGRCALSTGHTAVPPPAICVAGFQLLVTVEASRNDRSSS